jgi:hypothetical protein
MVKIGRNEICHCGSGIKYKKCCLNNKSIQMNKNENSEKIQKCIDFIQSKHKNHQFINISNELNSSNYRDYQVKYYYQNIVMIAEKTSKNESVFMNRINDLQSDIIVMYHGSYRTFPFHELYFIINSISEMIL